MTRRKRFEPGKWEGPALAGPSARAVIGTLDRYQVATTDMLQLLHFNTPSYGIKVLGGLYRSGQIARLERKVERSRGSTQVLHAALGAKLTAFTEHTLASNRFLMAAERLAKEDPRFVIAELLTEQEIRKYGLLGQYDLLPDGLLALRTRRNTFTALLVEVDLGSERRGAWERKVQIYGRFLRSSEYQSRYTSTTVVVIAHTEQRMHVLMNWTHSVATDPSLYCFTYARVLTPHQLFREPVWFDLSGNPTKL